MYRTPTPTFVGGTLGVTGLSAGAPLLIGVALVVLGLLLLRLALVGSARRRA